MNMHKNADQRLQNDYCQKFSRGTGTICVRAFALRKRSCDPTSPQPLQKGAAWVSRLTWVGLIREPEVRTRLLILYTDG